MAILPDYVPVPRASLGPAVNDRGYYVGRVERNLFWITDGDYHSAFLTTRDGVVGVVVRVDQVGHRVAHALGGGDLVHGPPQVVADGRWRVE